ncbi:MAG: hypothetical protein A2046_07705 [Bacteroidetes bacterium GWA2_30_7]|nr:MAG: hypothetical protein A2046_07705 [Bacteroidetes bacterium GWA2_30_7]
MKHLRFVLPAFLFLNTLVLSQSSLPMKKISLFKNSTCLVSKEGQLKVKDGSLTLPIPASALYGTFWIGSAKENSLKSIVFKTDTLKTSTTAKYTDQIIRANIGSDAILTLQSGEKNEKNISGKILSYIPESGLVKIKEESGKITYINYQKIEYLSFSSDNSKFMNDSITRTAKLNFEKSSENASLMEYYLQQGMNWIPSYFLKITNDKEARLEMKATIENYAEDITDVEAEVVVGAPQLYYGQMLDPVTYNYITQASSTYSTLSYIDNNMLSNSLAQVQTASPYGRAADGDSYYTSSYTTEGEKNNDLYYYNLGKISLPKNSKGIFPVFASTLGYKDIYKAEITDKVNYASNMYCNTNEDNCDVYHSIELKNSTNFPFTTACVMVVTEKGQFMAQDQLKYTPTGAVSVIKLSKAIDVVMKNSEEEVTRVDNYKKIGKTTYNKVTIRGTITVENLQPKQVAIDVIKHVNGSVTNNGDSKVKKQKTYNSVNPYSDMNWTVALNSGEKKTLTYEYEVLFAPYQY